ncbi:MAG: DNA-binding protein [Frankiales bacterium]|nr:DNA-binding protein [Frankiales bacterium]
MTDLLARTVRATAAAAEADVLLTRAAELLVTEVDWVLADRVDEPDLVTRVAALCADGPLDLPEELGRPTTRRSSASSVGILPSVLSSPGHLLRLGAEDLRRIAAQELDRHAARQAAGMLARGVADVVIVGLVARGMPLGVLVLGVRDRLPDDLLRELPDVASHLAVALDAARLVTLQNVVARTMQESLLPALPAVPGLELAARYVPAARGLDVGGDWYDAFRTQDDVVLVIGDVTGHDLAAAARMADLRNLLRAHAVHGGLAPDEVLSALAATAAALGLDVSATVTVGRLAAEDEGRWRLRWCNAGHPPPLLLSQGEASWLAPPPDLMLGIDESSPRTTHEVVLQTGDAVVLFTDGLVEQRGSDLDARLEELRVAARDCTGRPDGLAEHLLRTLGGGAADDVALLVVRVGD